MTNNSPKLWTLWYDFHLRQRVVAAASSSEKLTLHLYNITIVQGKVEQFEALSPNSDQKRAANRYGGPRRDQKGQGDKEGRGTA